MRAGVAAVVLVALLAPWGRYPGILPDVLSGAPVLAAGVEAAADGKAISAVHDGISLIAMYPPPGVTFDVAIVAPEEGLENLTRALDLIGSQSPLAKSRIEALKKSGSVFITYDPRHPDTKANLATLQVAAFLPFYFEKDTEREGKNFLVVVGRHGIKWPPRELAGVLVHELVGHGIQHLEGRKQAMRLADIECEAWLYEEMAHQDFGIDKFSKEMIEFRRQLEDQCSTFLGHLRKNDPQGLRLWEVLDPDVPKLLDRFRAYLEGLRHRGVMKDALAFAEKTREAEYERIRREGSADEQNSLGVYFRDGIGEHPRNLARAAGMFEQAANKGYSEAQFNLGVLHENGAGVAQDYAIAAKWYRKAAAQGHKRAIKSLAGLERGHPGIVR